jgi:uncharacterized OB-fold protein
MTDTPHALADTIALPPPDALFTPAQDRFTAPFWEAAAMGRLCLPRCAACGTWAMPPLPFCPACRAQGHDWVQIDPPCGVLHSHTIVTRAIMPEMQGHLPFVPATVEFPQAGGLRLVAARVGMRLDDIRIGMALRARFDRRADGVAVPRFTRAE